MGSSMRSGRFCGLSSVAFGSTTSRKTRANLSCFAAGWKKTPRETRAFRQYWWLSASSAPRRQCGLRSSGRSNRLSAGRSRLCTTPSCHCRADRQHRACSFRRVGHSHRCACWSHGTRPVAALCHGGETGSLSLLYPSSVPRVGSRRGQGLATNLARSACRRHLCARSIHSFEPMGAVCSGRRCCFDRHRCLGSFSSLLVPQLVPTKKHQAMRLRSHVPIRGLPNSPLNRLSRLGCRGSCCVRGNDFVVLPQVLAEGPDRNSNPQPAQRHSHYALPKTLLSNLYLSTSWGRDCGPRRDCAYRSVLWSSCPDLPEVRVEDRPSVEASRPDRHGAIVNPPKSEDVRKEA